MTHALRLCYGSLLQNVTGYCFLSLLTVYFCLCQFKILKIRILNIRMGFARQTKNTLIFKIHP